MTPQELIEAIRKENPDIIGLSGLLVKSAQQMVVTAKDLDKADISIPIMVGGAALSRKFTNMKISPEYKGPVYTRRTPWTAYRSPISCGRTRRSFSRKRSRCTRRRRGKSRRKP
ncbi:hypothetical protein PO124_10980 [Bacillus licheniformis]|nr:hypothetical protein [Bacillus licheniformis]